ncbi:MAG: amino acid permease [Candidatus Cloacimonetes bacterium]|jgi:amino acid transporter|nr:amino acid permease [Candidatus Cloacimonadota bacterium]MCK9433639.1 amino acid permease [Candidatus Cloacimonadota bacterium]
MSEQKKSGHGFGTAPVFLAAISTILGAVMFLRFGYAVGNVGLAGSLMIVLIGHMITIPTGLAIAEIATNLKVRGGGEYYIISRSFGSTLGGTIGISLYLSQAISVAFYLIAFAEAFRPLLNYFADLTGYIPDIRVISIPAAVILTLILSRKGASIGVNALMGIVITLGISLVLIFAGKGMLSEGTAIGLFDKVENPHSFFKVFAIVFPAFTGMTAGVGLSGDLRDPRKSIPLGTLTATLTGLAVYILLVFKLSNSASPQDLASDQFILSKISLWGPSVFIGLGAATLSSSLGSFLVAPRTLQALSSDRFFPSTAWNKFLSKGKGTSNEPVNATWVTAAIVFVFVAIGDVDFVAQIISMFFMITYGTLCTISFLEHFAGNPSYRPTFKTKWYFSLIGAISSFLMMFMMQPAYALASILVITGIYLWLNKTRAGERNLAMVFRGVLFQSTRKLQIAIQKRNAAPDMSNWRPSIIAITEYSEDRVAVFNLLRWLSHHYGFGSYIHFIKGPLNLATNNESKKILQNLINQSQISSAGFYVDTIVAPTFKTAVAQIVQIPGINGMENNSILFNFYKDNKDEIPPIIEGCYFTAVTGLNALILRSGTRHFGFRSRIDIWLTPGDYRNANLMILLSYILIGHREWKNCQIRVYDVVDSGHAHANKLDEQISSGRLPISRGNIQKIEKKPDEDLPDVMSKVSCDADLIVLGLSLKKMRRDGGKYLLSFPCAQDMLFVRAGQKILIDSETDEDDIIEGVEDNINPVDPNKEETGVSETKTDDSKQSRPDQSKSEIVT